MFEQRSYAAELIDLGPTHYTLDEYHDCLKQLNKIGIWLGGNAASLEALKKMPKAPGSILDVGCGAGFFTIQMAKYFPQAKIVGIDINPQAIDFANNLLVGMPKRPANVSFILKTQPELNELPKSFDVVLSTLVCHHLDDEVLIGFLQKACLVAKQKVIINDLHRHPLAYAAFKAISPLFFRNRLIMHDGPLSVQRAFTRQEWHDYLHKAGLGKKRHSIRWRWAFRWLVEIDCTGGKTC